MKLALIFVFAVLAVCLTQAAPPKEKTDAKCVPEKCKQLYDPVCAGNGVDKPRTFGSPCVLRAHNCEHNQDLKQVGKGACPNSGGVRLS